MEEWQEYDADILKPDQLTEIDEVDDEDILPSTTTSTIYTTTPVLTTSKPPPPDFKIHVILIIDDEGSLGGRIRWEQPETVVVHRIEWGMKDCQEDCQFEVEHTEYLDLFHPMVGDCFFADRFNQNFFILLVISIFSFAAQRRSVHSFTEVHRRVLGPRSGSGWL